MTDTTSQSQTQETLPLSEAAVSTASPGASEAQSAASTEVTRPEWLDERFWDADAKAPKVEDLARTHAELAAFKAEADSRAAARPETVDGYTLPDAMPEGVELPEGVEWNFDQNDPRLALGREIAHAMGLDQHGFEQQLLKPFIQYEAGRVKAASEEEAAMVATQSEALGPKADERRSAVKNWFAAQAGADAAELIGHSLNVAPIVVAFEKIMRRGAGGVSGFNGNGRDMKPAATSEEEYAAMSPADRLVNARRAHASGASR